MPGTPTTVTACLAALPPERRAAMAAVRRVIRSHIPEGYREALTRGLITWIVPLSVYPDTYNGHALWYVALGAQKNYLSVYLMGAYGSPALTGRLQEGFRAAGKRLDMGKSCIRFRQASDLALDVVGSVVASVPMRAFVASAESARRRQRRRAEPDLSASGGNRGQDR